MNERELFIAALQKDDPAGRAAFLAEAGGGDVELRQRVERLLRLHDDAGSFLQKPAVEPGLTGAYVPVPGGEAERADSREAPGTRLGPSKLLLLIGEGVAETGREGSPSRTPRRTATAGRRQAALPRQRPRPLRRAGQGRGVVPRLVPPRILRDARRRTRAGPQPAGHGRWL
jgi:hypothetical protein